MTLYVILVLACLCTVTAAWKTPYPGVIDFGSDVNITWDGDEMVINNIKMENISQVVDLIRRNYPGAEITLEFYDDGIPLNLAADITQAAKDGKYDDVKTMLTNYFKDAVKKMKGDKTKYNELYKKVTDAIVEALKSAKGDKDILKQRLSEVFNVNEVETVNGQRIYGDGNLVNLKFAIISVIDKN